MSKRNVPHPSSLVSRKRPPGVRAVFKSSLGQLYQGDCLKLLKAIPDASIDMIFADPPFNLRKDYGPGVSDELAEMEYLTWNRSWLTECVRVVRPGGAIFVFNLPRWLIPTGALLDELGMDFRHWIACRMPKTYPRAMKLAPAHYGCLYYTKGKPRTFNKVFVPIPTCRHCHGEIRDYGGHRKALNPAGINLMDFFDLPEEVFIDSLSTLPPGKAWTEMEDSLEDIPPVRHAKFKTRGANELAPLLLERLIAMATNRGDLVLDPFGGGGTTYLAAERLARRWIGIELGTIVPIKQRLQAQERGELLPWERSRAELLARQQSQVAQHGVKRGKRGGETSQRDLFGVPIVAFGNKR